MPSEKYSIMIVLFVGNSSEIYEFKGHRRGGNRRLIENTYQDKSKNRLPVVKRPTPKEKRNETEVCETLFYFWNQFLRSNSKREKEERSLSWLFCHLGVFSVLSNGGNDCVLLLHHAVDSPDVLGGVGGVPDLSHGLQL